MEKKTISIAAVIITIMLCGLPGLAGVCFFSMALLGSFTPEAIIPASDLPFVLGVVITMLCLSLVSVAIPIGAGIFGWWWQQPKIDIEGEPIPEDDF